MGIKDRIKSLKEALKIDQKKQELSKLKEEFGDPNIWQNEALASSLGSKISILEKTVKAWEDLNEFAELAEDTDLSELESAVSELETKTLYSGQYDNYGAIVQIYSGAGGVDAQDWASMLLKMYLRFAEEQKLEAKVVEVTEGAEAGIKNTTLEIKGELSYGKLKGEHGVHRLVRLSPFNAKNLRQTSFTLVEVIPEIEEQTNLTIEEKDLKIDVYRASGHGGQSVNTTDSAVRITHLPTGLVVTCQNERSQLQNRETAMKILRSKLLKMMQDQHKENLSELRGESQSNEWGSQIRSYVIHPYKLVKDHRTGFESTNPEAVLNGGLTGFIEAYIRYLNNQV